MYTLYSTMFVAQFQRNVLLEDLAESNVYKFLTKGENSASSFTVVSTGNAINNSARWQSAGKLVYYIKLLLYKICKLLFFEKMCCVTKRHFL
jgi:hypothetical protein